MSIQITSDLQENIRNFEELFSDCQDIKKRKIKVGEHLQQECYIANKETKFVLAELGNDAGICGAAKLIL